ncbi:hypothetical protein IC757_15370 [Wenzhouxiangella sp. AB-CW3]|uniref:hypothetical protein n=1 Tax=Wenzhouxiangella sp. AB-CW3 TaxID=2771012 RepID=UPI00168A58F3|nr:hypothetical protein [Wenzhouxiangella sp. AB-CW3]QOC22370.1 hypothetical protein IC757_15370 [Wenzhouxiangella sp. AB-CW3]
MNTPDCLVEVNFSFRSSEPVFQYLLTSSSPGWQVSQDGNIRPPRRGRVVELRLAEASNAEFYGLRFANKDSEFPDDPNADRWFNDTHGQARMLNSRSARTLNFELDGQSHEIYYQLGINADGRIVWDDPRIYSDGSQ